MQHVIARVRQDCVQWLWLEVRPSNLIARKLYESMDFEFVAVRKNYYPAVDGREDAVILRLAVNEHA
jgi:ribosomal-protein-alanine N-acetyltransferase